MPSPRSAVASGHPAVTDTACQILEAGGNAFDAVIAAGFVSCLAEQTMTSLGGGGFLLAQPAGAEPVLFDFFVDTPGRGLELMPKPDLKPVTVEFPGSSQVFHIGPASAAVPGTLKGFLHVQRRLGQMPLNEVLEPAISYAREGVSLQPFQAHLIGMLQPILSSTEAARRHFAPSGKPLAAGDLVKQPESADFLAQLAHDGEADFYEGDLAARIAGDMKTADGLITLEDLSAYRVIERKPLKVGYRNVELLTNPAPSAGGRLIGLSLDLLSAFPRSAIVPGQQRHLSTLAAVMAEVDRLRDRYLQNGLGQEALRETGQNLRLATRGTTHLSVSDKAGNVASMTCSNGEGSGYIVPGTGIMLNNMMGEDDLHPNGFHASPAGLRVSSMMSPSVLLKAGAPLIVLGSGGSKRIRTAILQVLLNVVDAEMGLAEAVAAPRMHHSEGRFELEPGFDEGALERLKRRAEVNLWPERNLYFGGVHAVSTSGEAVGDARRAGSARVL